MKYIALNECIRLNGEHHLANAIGYASRGLFDYSDGSLHKAVRNFRRAQLMELPKLHPSLQAAVDELVRYFEHRFIYGDLK